jgi:hypothetical protein
VTSDGANVSLSACEKCYPSRNPKVHSSSPSFEGLGLPACFHFRIIWKLWIVQSIELLGRWFNPFQGHYQRRTTKTSKFRHPCLEWDLNPRSQCSSGWRISFFRSHPFWSDLTLLMHMFLGIQLRNDYYCRFIDAYNSVLKIRFYIKYFG